MIKKWGVKFGSFDFALWVGLCGRGKSKCANAGWQKNFKFFCAVEKKLKHEALGCRVGKKSALWSIFIPVDFKFVSPDMVFLFFFLRLQPTIS